MKRRKANECVNPWDADAARMLRLSDDSIRCFFGNTWCTLCSINKAVLAKDFKTIQFEGRHKDCPLVDLGSHGDLIDRDALKNAVLKWMPPDPCGKEEKEFPFETDICVSMMQEIEEQDAVIEAEGAEE